MREIKTPPLALDRAQAVAVVESMNGLDIVCGYESGAVDAVELRLDQLGMLPVGRDLARLTTPWIATVRDPTEGGNPAVTQAARSELLFSAASCASAVDVELRNLVPLSSEIAAIRAGGAVLVLSYHDFSGAPAYEVAAEMLERAANAGADIFKIAVTPRHPSEVGALMQLLDAPAIPVSLMAMGPWGRAARLVYAACGSVLNYGWVEKPVVSGQWQALELKQQIARVTPESDLR